MNGSSGIPPGGQVPVGRGHDGAPRREPQRELLRRVEVERPADRPGFDERALLPQRRADIGPLDSVDPGRKLQFGRCLHLRVHAAHGAHHLDELAAPGTLGERRACQAPRPYLVPADLHTTTVVAPLARAW